MKAIRTAVLMVAFIVGCALGNSLYAFTESWAQTPTPNACELRVQIVEQGRRVAETEWAQAVVQLRAAEAKLAALAKPEEKK